MFIKSISVFLFVFVFVLVFVYALVFAFVFVFVFDVQISSTHLVSQQTCLDWAFFFFGEISEHVYQILISLIL